MNTRELKGKEIAARLKIHKQDNKWIVPSQTGKGKYTVDIEGKAPHCTCPDFELRGYKCKHIYAVEYTIKSETDTKNHTTTVTKTVRVTYKQDWPMYNAAQTNEKAHFQSLLYDLCQGIEEPDQHMGRPREPVPQQVHSLPSPSHPLLHRRSSRQKYRRVCPGSIGSLEVCPGQVFLYAWRQSDGRAFVDAVQTSAARHRSNWPGGAGRRSSPGERLSG